MSKQTVWPDVPSAVTMAERDWLVAQAKGRACIVHIGVDRGMSLYASRAGNPKARIYGVDVDMAGFDNTIDAVLILGNSHLVHKGFDREIDFLFIDGDHSKAAVLADMLGWLPKVNPGGVVAFHDYGNISFVWCQGVSEAVNEWDWSGWTEIPAAGSIKAYRKDDE